MVGDAVADMRAGADAGVRTIACLWGTGRPQALVHCAPWRTVADFGELTELLLAGLRRIRPSGAHNRLRPAWQERPR